MKTASSNALFVYVGRFREFQPIDWVVYLAWVGVMAGLAVASSAFLAIGARAGAVFPAEAYLLPIGAAIFTVAIAVDTIGHRTVYKEILRGGEALVHHVTIATGIGACLLLIAAYPQRTGLAHRGGGVHRAVLPLQPDRRGDALAPLPQPRARTWSRCGATSSS